MHEFLKPTLAFPLTTSTNPYITKASVFFSCVIYFITFFNFLRYLENVIIYITKLKNTLTLEIYGFV